MICNILKAKKHYCIFLMLIFFCIIYILKITGWADFTANYDIEWMKSYYQNLDTPLMIDNNYNSTWGIRGDYHFEGEEIIIKFSKYRPFSGIRICNMSSFGDNDIDIYVSADGESYYKCECSVYQLDEHLKEYNIGMSLDILFLMIKKCDSKNEWPITELIINE